MVLSGPQRILLICLLHFCTRSFGQDVDPKVLMSIVKNFEKQLTGQYAVVFRVEKSKCLAGSNYGGGDLITEEVKETLGRNEVYESENLIAAMADKDKQEHSEFRLKGYLKNFLEKDKDQDQCVIYFTVNSPCLDKCLSNIGKVSIKDNLHRLQSYFGTTAFAFKKVWEYDKKEDVINKLKKIEEFLPYYQCEGNKASCDRL